MLRHALNRVIRSQKQDYFARDHLRQHDLILFKVAFELREWDDVDRFQLRLGSEIHIKVRFANLDRVLRTREEETALKFLVRFRVSDHLTIAVLNVIVHVRLQLEGRGYAQRWVGGGFDVESLVIRNAVGEVQIQILGAVYPLGSAALLFDDAAYSPA